MGVEFLGVFLGGNWFYVEFKYCIKYLEMLVILLGFEVFVKDNSNIYIRIMYDNIIVVDVIDYMGKSYLDLYNFVV